MLTLAFAALLLEGVQPWSVPASCLAGRLRAAGAPRMLRGRACGLRVPGLGGRAAAQQQGRGLPLSMTGARAAGRMLRRLLLLPLLLIILARLCCTLNAARGYARNLSLLAPPRRRAALASGVERAPRPGRCAHGKAGRHCRRQ
jgi:hypothetical protein